MADWLETHRRIELEQVQCREKINEKIVKRRMRNWVGKAEHTEAGVKEKWRGQDG